MIMKKIFLCAAAILLQAAFFPFFMVRGASFNAMLFVLTLFCFSGSGAAELFSYAIFSGAVLDALSGAPFGALSLAYAAAAVFLSLFARIFPHENTVHFGIFILSASVFFSFIAQGMSVITGSFPAPIILSALFAALAYNMVGGVSMYYVMKKWITL